MDYQNLKAWFSDRKRDLPWRENPSPYAVWVSEVMLQQTQVTVVIPYFLRWMERFPTVQALAEASLDEVIKMWEGLGYYSRARFLHQGAKKVMECFSGNIPDNPEDLSQIKGLGNYTVGAILSFAFHKRVAAVDGNVVRVLTRYLKIEEDIAKPRTLTQLRQTLEEMLPEEEPWIVNEALIELGATICQKKPKCRECPLMKSCRGYAANVAEKMPYKSTKTKIEPLYRIVGLIEWNGHLLIRRVGKGEIMSDLHEFPYCEITKEVGEKEALEMLGIPGTLVKSLPKVSHSFTRFRVQLFPYHINSKTKIAVPGYVWVKKEKVNELAFSSGHRRVLHLFNALDAALVEN